LHSGKFAGHTLKEACVAQWAAWAKERAQRATPSMHIATVSIQYISRLLLPTPSTTPSNFMLINGIIWVPLLSTTDTVQITLGPIVDPEFGFSALYADTKGDHINHWVSINWHKFSFPTGGTDTSSAYHTFPACTMPQSSPFVLDSGASCHISPKQSDFKMLTPTPPHPIMEFSRSCVHAIGIGTIELQTKSSICLMLNCVLFILNSTVHLISVFSINDSGNNTCYFDARSCCMIDPTGMVIMTETAWKQCHLYTLNCVAHNVNNASTNEPPLMSTHPTTSSTLYVTKTPDLET
jgi:hypothetical protein